MARLNGLRILIVEDDALLAFDLDDLLREAGAQTIGPALNLATGLNLIALHPIDAALLDIDLGSEKVWPLAFELTNQGTPFAFVSAQTAVRDRPPPLADTRCLAKPARPGDVLDLVAKLVQRDPDTPSRPIMPLPKPGC